MEQIRIAVIYWLPLIQGFAALASVAGALLSWKYALKAQRAREQMTKNIVSSRLIQELNEALQYFRSFRQESITQEGKPDFAKYQLHEQRNMHVLEKVSAALVAAAPYFKEKPSTWHDGVHTIAEAARTPRPLNIEGATKTLGLLTEQLRIQATTREISPSE
ncbi:hypothetical protein [Stutzerimonas stutzeri]|jgi:hypothetical protein|uniref:hypothetical protein n=1 Tax=Stutzerimonas stutzeri TaxID=316 RepID=UPI00039663C6|nr:hypothetical protein [Stutzerimonas stutzeri]EQM72923.1 hypothetical protein L686_22745 [Stutzerimonas stutzeri MF28]